MQFRLPGRMLAAATGTPRAERAKSRRDIGIRTFLKFFVFFCGPLKNVIPLARAHARCRHRDASERAKSRRAIGIRTFLKFFVFFLWTPEKCNSDCQVACSAPPP